MKPEPVKTVAVIGAGTMGYSIAQVFATSAIDVNLVDQNDQILTRALGLIRASLTTLVEFGRIEEKLVPDILARVHPFTDLPSAVAPVPFVLEAVPEVPAIKEDVFARIVRHTPGDAIIASNTSTLDIFGLVPREASRRTVTTHWFVPAHIIPLVEIAPGPDTQPEAVSFTKGLMERIGKRAVVMKKFVPLFLVNRIQKAALTAVYEIIGNHWAAPEDLDLAVKLCLGVRLPILGFAQSLDFNGLDTILALNRVTGIDLPLIEQRVKDGYLGVKTSKGIYDYGGRSEEEILRKRDALLLKMLDCLDELGAFEPV